MRISGLNWRRWAFILGMVGCVQFIFLTVVAMFLYPGGSYADHDTTGYSFWINFFSDLGRTETFGEHPNATSMALFITALSLASLTLVAALRPNSGQLCLPGRTILGASERDACTMMELRNRE